MVNKTITDQSSSKSRKAEKNLTNMFVCLMVFNATFNNILLISWRPVLLVEETAVPGENHGPLAGH